MSVHSCITAFRVYDVQLFQTATLFHRETWQPQKHWSPGTCATVLDLTVFTSTEALGQKMRLLYVLRRCNISELIFQLRHVFNISSMCSRSHPTQEGHKNVFFVDLLTYNTLDLNISITEAAAAQWVEVLQQKHSGERRNSAKLNCLGSAYQLSGKTWSEPHTHTHTHTQHAQSVFLMWETAVKDLR